VPEWAGVTRPYLAAIVVLLSLSGCGTGAMSLLSGGGPNVAANVQAGRTNTQTIGQTVLTEQRLVNATAQKIVQSSGDSQITTDKVQSLVINNFNPLWAILLVLWSLLLWELPRPRDVWRGLRRLFQRGSPA
jgi:hypothetical protein